MFSKYFKKEPTKLENISSEAETIPEEKITDQSTEIPHSYDDVIKEQIDINYQTELVDIDEISEIERQRINDELVELIKQDLLSASSIEELDEKTDQINSSIGITDYEWDTIYNNPTILGYETRKQQLNVFKNVLPPEFNPYEDTLLDVGCGIGDLWAYCVEILKCDAPLYTGIDTDIEIIKLAQKKFPNVADNFIVDDLNIHASTNRYDWVVAMSAFNEITVIEDKQVSLNIEDIIKQMYSIANKGIALNLMHTHLTESDKDVLHIYDPNKIIDWVLENYDNVKFHKNYINRDFYLCIYK